MLMRTILIMIIRSILILIIIISVAVLVLVIVIVTILIGAVRSLPWNLSVSSILECRRSSGRRS